MVLGPSNLVVWSYNNLHVVRSDNMKQPILNAKVTLIGHQEREGYLTGLSKYGRRGELWQVYWTYNPTGADNICQWIPCDQIMGLEEGR